MKSKGAVLLLIFFGVAAGVALAAWWSSPTRAKAMELRGQIAELGGWSPAHITLKVDQPLHLQLSSADVAHSFAIGQSTAAPIEVPPGQIVETTLTFDTPGKYVFYCARWCSVSHWRMRGTIEVVGESAVAGESAPPKYVSLGINLDEDHRTNDIPLQTPDAAAARPLVANLPDGYLADNVYLADSPAAVWRKLRAEPFTASLTDSQVWGMVAFIWQSHTTSRALIEARSLYEQNCAACHGEAGEGDGSMANALISQITGSHAEGGIQQPTDFTDSALMLGANSALLQGKILRGGMGTGMPYWGPIFTDEQTWALVSYLWTFQFNYEVTP